MNRRSIGSETMRECLNTAEQLKETLLYLEDKRKGFKYHLNLSFTKSGYLVSVIGESREDKSLPHTFVQVTCENFEQLPQLVHAKCQQFILDQIKANESAIESLRQLNLKLEIEVIKLKTLATKI